MAGTTRLRSNLSLKEDDLKFSIGAAGATDCYVTFDGSDMTFYDSTVGTTKTLTQLAAAGSPTLDAAFDGGKEINGANSSANAVIIGDGTDQIRIYRNAANDMYIDTTSASALTINSASGAISFGDENLTTTGTINIGADAINLTLGAAGATDAYVQFDGTDMLFYDSNLGTTVSLSTMAGANLNTPTVVGNMVISDGQLAIADSDDEVALQVTSAATTNPSAVISSTTATTGELLRLQGNNAANVMYLSCYHVGVADQFTVTRYGAITMAGNAATDIITVTAGDVQVTDGNLDMDEGIIEVDSTGDETTYIKRNHGTSTKSVVELEQTHTGSTGPVLLLDQNATGNAKTLEISTAGDGAIIDVAASAARTGNVITVAMADQVAETVLDITGAATGTNGEGIIHVDVTGALAGNAIRVDSTGANAATGQLMYLLSSGNQAGATNGICGYFQDTGNAAATSYAVYISSTNNEALHVDAGKSVFDESVTISLADNTGPALAVTNPDTTGNTNAVTITPSGSGSGLLITPQEVDTVGMTITTGAANATVSSIVVDGATVDWVGGASTGMVHLTADGAIAADASLLRIASSGQPAAANDGACLEILETGAAQATSYAMRITSTNNEALHVDAGTVVVDETVKATAGIITVNSENDVTDPPTQAEMDTAFGAGAAANDGMIGIINDAGAGTNTWLCVNTNGAWYYAAKLTIGA